MSATAEALKKVQRLHDYWRDRLKAAPAPYTGQRALMGFTMLDVYLHRVMGRPDPAAVAWPSQEPMIELPKLRSEVLATGVCFLLMELAGELDADRQCPGCDAFLLTNRAAWAPDLCPDCKADADDRAEDAAGGLSDE